MPKDPAQALKEKLAALAQQAQSAKPVKPENKRFKRAAANSATGDGKQGDKQSEYLAMVRQLKSVDGENGSGGGKWLVR